MIGPPFEIRALGLAGHSSVKPKPRDGCSFSPREKVPQADEGLGQDGPR